MRAQAAAAASAALEDFTAAENVLAPGGSGPPGYHLFVELAPGAEGRVLTEAERGGFDGALRRASAVYDSYRGKDAIAPAHVHQVAPPSLPPSSVQRRRQPCRPSARCV